MSSWSVGQKITFGGLSAAAVVAALAASTGAQRAQSLGVTQHGALVTAQDAGAADAVALVPVAPGTTGQVLTVGDAGLPVWRAPAAAGGPTVTTLRASDCTAEAGNDSASITGTGAASTFTLTAAAAPNPLRVYSSSGATAARILCAIPAGAARVEAEIGVTAVANLNSSGARYLAAVMRPGGGGTPTVAWGASWNDNASAYWGNLTTGANAGTLGNVPSSPAADRWFRVAWDMTQPQLGLMFGTGSGGARPSAWTPPNVAAPMPSGTTAFLVDTTGNATQLAVYLQSFGGGSGTASITGSLTIRVLSL